MERRLVPAKRTEEMDRDLSRMRRRQRSSGEPHERKKFRRSFLTLEGQFLPDVGVGGRALSSHQHNGTSEAGRKRRGEILTGLKKELSFQERGERNCPERGMSHDKKRKVKKKKKLSRPEKGRTKNVGKSDLHRRKTDKIPLPI